MAIDFGSTPVTGIHVRAVEKIRGHYGLERKPVKVIEPYQMLGEIDDDLRDLMGIDTIGLTPRLNMFGFPNEDWKEFDTFWGQKILVPGDFNTRLDDEGGLLLYPAGDMTVDPCARMPAAGYFFDAIIRQSVEETVYRMRQEYTKKLIVLKFETIEDGPLVAAAK